VLIEFAAGRSTHTLHLTQRGRSIEGVHQGDFVARDLTGSLEGQAVALESDYPEVHGDALHFRFAGTVAGDAMSGTLDMGEYRAARWSAKRRLRGRG
jgi:L-seryl-tRNA(Ser) seleniumtransferase